MEHDTLVLAGSTVSWSLYSKGNLDYVDFPAARIATGRTVSPFLPHLVLGPYDGTLLAGPASDGRSVVFGETQVENDATCLAQQQFDFTCPIVGTGRVWTVDSSLRRRRLASAAALLVAVADGRIAVVSRKDRALGFRTPEALVVVRNARDGSKLGTIAASGPPVALALSPSLGAVLVVRGTGRRIEWFDPRAIRPGDAIDVPDTVQTIGVAGGLIVYRVGRRIFGFRPPAAEPVLLAAASPAWTIVGPEITAKRLLWAEYGREKGRWVSRLRTLDVP
jgi:hypothetical protein